MLFLVFLLTSGTECRTPLSCSPNFLRQYQYRQYLDIRTLTHELIVKYAKKEQSYANDERPMNQKKLHLLRRQHKKNTTDERKRFLALTSVEQQTTK